VAIAEDNGITIGDDFKIKFQQYDNWPTNDDGRAYDAISITPQQSALDWFQFDLDANQSATISASTVLGGGDVSLSLYDAAGSILQTGIASDNFNSVITDFSDETGGTFFARVDGSLGTQYNLVVTRGAALDVEPNDAANPLPIDGRIGVFGHVSNFSTGTTDPDAAENGERIDGFFDGVTLSNPVDGGGVYAPFASFAPTGERVFGPTPTSADGFREFETEFQADFNSLQSSVSIDIGSDDAADVGFLRAYDLQGNLLDEVISGSLATGESETLTITRSTPEIAYIIAAGLGTDITPLDNLVFTNGQADTDHFSVELGLRDTLSIDAYLPGAGPNLFDNGLDQTTSQLVVELIDPNGTTVVTDSQQLEHVAATAGTYVIKVSANSNEGEYLLRHSVQTAIKVTGVAIGDSTNSRSVVDQLTLDFDNIVNPQAGAFELIQRESGQTVDLNWTIDNSSGVSQVIVDFSGALVENGGSLVDGNYQLNIDGTLLGGSVPGSDFTFGDQESDGFYRYFGDFDGNKNVNVFDLLGFRQTYRLTSADAGFDARFDSNGDGNINVLDLLRFRQNFGTSLTWV